MQKPNAWSNGLASPLEHAGTGKPIPVYLRIIGFAVGVAVGVGLA